MTINQSGSPSSRSATAALATASKTPISYFSPSHFLKAACASISGLPYKPALDVDVQSSPGCDYRITRQVVDEARFIEPVASRNDIVVVGMLVAHLHQARRRMTI